MIFNNTTGHYNTVVGNHALSNNNTGNYNVAFGYQAMGYVTPAEPFTEWYKAAVKEKGLTPHKVDEDGRTFGY